MRPDEFSTPAPLSGDVSSRLSVTRGRDTAPELALRSLLHARGLRYRVDMAPVPGLRRRSDVLFTRARVAVFIDGCFWHGCPEHMTWPRHNAQFWRVKIETNRARDRDTDHRLKRAGWTVIRAWEHEMPNDVADRVEVAVRNAQRAQGRPLDV
jgi:DNA mismatch endonuclease (patch repair protein)